MSAELEPTRRSLLRLAGAAGAFATAVLAVPSAAMARPKPKASGFVVYRMSVRGTSSCKACKRHHARFAYLTHALADAHRAHPGCNCPIRTQKIRRRTFRRLFPAGSGGVADLGAITKEGRV